jgi:hypothetical protein
MKEYFKFIKELDSKWYILLPTWKGDKEDLEMVMGADTMLDIIAQGETDVEILISTDEFENYKFKLTFKNAESDGGWYSLESELFNFDVWLCKVTKFVFSEMPKNLYII